MHPFPKIRKLQYCVTVFSRVKQDKNTITLMCLYMLYVHTQAILECVSNYELSCRYRMYSGFICDTF